MRVIIRIEWDFWVHKWTPEAVMDLVRREIDTSMGPMVKLTPEPGRIAAIIVERPDDDFGSSFFVWAFRIQEILFKEFQIVSKIRVKGDRVPYEHFEEVGQLIDRDFFAAARREKRLEQQIEETVKILKRSKTAKTTKAVIELLELAIARGY